MHSLLAVLFAVLFAGSAPAQERHVSVQLLDGETVEGAVVSMDAAALRVQVGDRVRTIDATRIRTCHFDESAAAQPEPAAPTPSATKVAQEPKRAHDDKAGQEPGKPAANKAKPAARGARGGAVPAASDVPLDVRNRSLLRARLNSLDDTYPWLQPTAPMQWLSLGLLLSIALSLTVHASAKVAGSEAATLPRSACIGIWYLVGGFMQVAAVPVSNLSIVLMLLANPAIALFLLTSLFGLTRLGAFIALAVQLGFAALGFGVLELVTAVLGSIAPPTS